MGFSIWIYEFGFRQCNGLINSPKTSTTNHPHLKNLPKASFRIHAHNFVLVHIFVVIIVIIVVIVIVVVVIVAVDRADDVNNCVEHGHNKGQKGQLRISIPFHHLFHHCIQVPFLVVRLVPIKMC